MNLHVVNHIIRETIIFSFSVINALNKAFIFSLNEGFKIMFAVKKVLSRFLRFFVI